PEDTNVTDGESDVSPAPNQQPASVTPDTLSPDISSPDISLSSDGSPTEVSSLDPDSSDSGLPESGLSDVQMPDSDTPASEGPGMDDVPFAAPDNDSNQTNTVATGDAKPELSSTMPASLSDVSTEASEPDPVPAAGPETIDDFLQLAADDLESQLESQLGASDSPWQPNDLDAFVDRIETFAPTLDSAGQWSEPAIAIQTGETFSEKHRERSLELAKRLRSALAIDAGDTGFAITSDELVSFRTRLDMTIASNLIRATMGAANENGDTQQTLISTTQPDDLSASLDSLREAIALEGVDSSNGSIPPRLADAAYLIALPTINQNEISFDGNGLARVERVQKDLARAMAMNVEPVRLSAVADSQGRCLLALRELRDQTIGQPSESIDVLKTIDRLSMAFVRDLDRRTDHADRQNGWQRIRGPVNVLGHTVAGLTLWDADRLSDAMRHWIEVPNDSVMSQMGPDRWRDEVATRCLEWVRENSGANDRDTSTLRYARSTKSREGVLNLAVKFADASEDLQEQIVPERFLLAVAKQDDTNAARLWDRMGLDLDDDRLTPQLGFALWTSCSRRHDAATSRRQRIDVIPDLIVGTLAQLNSRDRDRPVETAASLDPTLSQRIETTLQRLRDVADNSDEAFAVLPGNLMAAPTRQLCERYVDEVRSANAPATYRGFLDRLERVRFAASTAASLASDSAEKDRMLLIAAEAFIQTRYEEIDDLPASRMIQTLYQYEDAGDRRSRSQPTIHRQFLVARAADQRGFLSREDEDVLRHYVQARNAYSKLIENRELPDDLRGSVHRCRASLLSRMAVLEPPTRKRELLELAAKDGSAAISYPPRWHHDNDDRLTTAADVNISTVRLVTDLEVAEKQKLLDDADRFLAEAIAVREQNGYPVFIQKTHRLNGYLFDLLMSPKGRRVSNREQRAMTLMSQLATEPIEGAGDDAISHTIPATSYRTRVHWHCMCAMVHRLAEHPEMAMSHIQHALHTAEDHLPRNDDRRHRAVLIYVQFRGPELLSGISKNGQADPSLVRELRSHLDTIIEPNAHFRKEKQGYVRDLDRMSK
ncbi:MAG: serine/threonine protein kinase, partial [Rhodopirellula sp. JB044]|uniref:serine/threonine protein kinase n=1 Tax=Rhodopirellula sp. JB044 TaxID=3342844 RepID=UPI00370CE05E